MRHPRRATQSLAAVLVEALQLCEAGDEVARGTRPSGGQLAVARPSWVSADSDLTPRGASLYASANPWSATMGVKGVRIDYLLPG